MGGGTARSPRRTGMTDLDGAVATAAVDRAPTETTSKAPGRTISGREVDPVQAGPAPEQAPAGEYPYTRGIHPHMYRTRLWTMRMFAGFGSPEDTNRRFRHLLAQGQTGLS